MDISKMLFQGWEDLVRVGLVGVLAYVTLIVFLRISGKRTLAKLNAFDLVVTVALGSTLSALLLQESVSLAEGTAALALLIAMQFAVTYTSVRSKRMAELVRSEPTLLLRHGQLLDGAMRAQRITPDEALSAARASGAVSLDEVDYLFLESDGSLSVIVDAASAAGGRRPAAA